MALTTSTLVIIGIEIPKEWYGKKAELSSGVLHEVLLPSRYDCQVLC
jgi:hypothetical protein